MSKLLQKQLSFNPDEMLEKDWSHLIGDICLPLGLHVQLQNRSVNVLKQDFEPSELPSASPEGHRRLRYLEVCAISAEAAALMS
ncbi:unnamed protein product [Rangifer tarandus platyrhynchus]|uniref:Uncharacterized protein n=1 Tax=Rangifer tarandus platyrhynchus TaxID=3082113 RepID=A0AC60A4X2_RANTA